MRGLILAVFSGALTVMVPAVAAQELESLQVYAGIRPERGDLRAAQSRSIPGTWE